MLQVNCCLSGQVKVRPGAPCFWFNLLYYYGASEASVVFRRLTEISEYERPAGRPWSRVSQAHISATTWPIYMR